VKLLQAIGVEVRARTRPLLSDVSIDVAPGELVAIIGPNGAGKSTLLNALAGDRPLASGEILLDGRPLSQWSKLELARRRTVLPQHSAVAFDFTGLQIAMLGLLAFRGSLSERQMQALAERALAETEALAFADRPYTVLSGGERQRVQLARVLAQCDADPAATPFLLLDEPITGLDRGLGVLAVLHDLNMAARYADRVGIVEKGRVTNLGPTRETLDPQRLSAVFATPIVRIDATSGTAFLSPG
jgi:iron complex transport system ATP-binding protein